MSYGHPVIANATKYGDFQALSRKKWSELGEESARACELGCLQRIAFALELIADRMIPCNVDEDNKKRMAEIFQDGLEKEHNAMEDKYLISHANRVEEEGKAYKIRGMSELIRRARCKVLQTGWGIVRKVEDSSGFVTEDNWKLIGQSLERMTFQNIAPTVMPGRGTVMYKKIAEANPDWFPKDAS